MQSSRFPIVIVGIVIIVVAIAVISAFVTGRDGEVAQTSAPPPPPAAGPEPVKGLPPPPASGSIKPPPVKASPPPKPPPAVPAQITVLTPREADAWLIGELHTVAWSRGAGVTGGVALVNADTGGIVGWILSNFTAKQTAFSWDTRDVFLNRVAGVKENVKAGIYRVRFVFDEKFTPVEGAAFSLVSSGSEVLTYTVRLQNETVTPEVLTVSRGAKVIFVNNDSVVHGISSATIPAFSLAPNGGIYILDTGTLPSDTHYYTSNIYSFRAPGTLIVK